MPSKKFERSLVVGKFSPLHKGHEFLINSALEQSDELIIFCYSEKSLDGTDAQTKERWLKCLFPNALIYSFDRKSEPTIPDDDETDFVQREFVADYYRRKVNRPLAAIFTSEDYGPGFAQHMQNALIRDGVQLSPVVHCEVDRARQKVPISASVLRSNLHEYRNFLSPVVYRDFVKEVLFLGAESTGKSTLVERCANVYNTIQVEEYGRLLYIERQGRLTYDDLLLIGKRHRELEESKKAKAKEFLFVDTSALTTMLYSQFLFEKVDPELAELAANKQYDLVFLCAPDFPMVQDGTRQDEEFRLRQHRWYLTELERRGIRYVLLEGSLEEKFRMIQKNLGAFAP